MSASGPSVLPTVLRQHETALLARWTDQLAAQARAGRISAAELQAQAREFLHRLTEAAQRGSLEDLDGPYWQPVRDQLADLSANRAQQGYSPSETAGFVLSLKEPLFDTLRTHLGGEGAGLVDAILQTTRVLDRLGLLTADAYQRGRESIILRQQQELMELSTPVVRLWDGILALPLIGTLDSARTQVVMESLLQSIVDTGSSIAIIDITGVPTVDTLVAQHLLKTVAAARLMGADCIISGIRPQTAQTIVHLGVDLSAVITKATLADAFVVALGRLGQQVAGGRAAR